LDLMIGQAAAFPEADLGESPPATLATLDGECAACLPLSCVRR